MRFVNHHYSRTEEFKRENSKRMMGNKHLLGYVPTEETRRKLAVAGIGVSGKYQRAEEHRKAAADLHRGNRYRVGHRHSEETKSEMSRTRKGRDNSKATVAAAEVNKGRKFSEEHLRRKSIAQKKLWADPAYHKAASFRLASANGTSRPNTKEIKIRALLDFLYPRKGRYTGDGSFIVGGKNPDFVLEINGEDLLIEMFGDYWHRGQDPQVRIDHFKPYGYRTLVIWEHELKHIPRLIKRIRKFVGLVKTEAA